MRFRFLIGYFRGGVFNLPISVELSREEVVISPQGLCRLLRFGRPYLELTLEQLTSARCVRYSAMMPMSAIEICYEKDGRERAFVIGLLWQRGKFPDALCSQGIRFES
jgi:hypothetical protein